MKTPGENPSSFEESIELNTAMTPQEAAEKLASFHGVDAERIPHFFINLRGFTDGTVKFQTGIANGAPCIVMVGYRPNGQRAWDHLINRISGNPISRTG